MANYRGNTTKFESQTNSLYNQAVSYYTQKKRDFLLRLYNKQNEQVDTLQIEEEFTQQMFAFLAQAWNSMDNYIMELINNDGTVKAARTSGGKFNRVIDILSSNPEQEMGKLLNAGKIDAASADLIINVFKNEEAIKSFKDITTTNKGKLMKSSIYTLSGYLYESFIQYALKEVVAVKGAEKISQINQELLSSFTQTGGMTIKEGTATKAAGASISPDVATGISKNNVNLSDLSFNQNIQIINRQETNSQNNDMSSSLYDFINSGREQMFGFSMKRWNMNSNNSYTHSSKLRDSLNTKYEKTEKTWNYKYANALMQLEMAKNIIALMGPINIGIFSGSHFYWMNDIIQSRMLVMHVYSKILQKKEEIKPYIQSTNVYLLDKSKLKGLQLEKIGKGKKAYYSINYNGSFE